MSRPVTLTISPHMLVGAAIFLAMFSCQYLHPLVGSGEAPSSHRNNDRETSLRNEIVQYALTLEGRPYRYGGREPRTGFDCSGLVNHVMNKFGIELSGPSYSLEGRGKNIMPEQARPGDLLFFRRTKNGKVYHVALVVSNEGGELRMIHASSSRGVVSEVLQYNSYWRSKFITARDVISSQQLHSGRFSSN